MSLARPLATSLSNPRPYWEGKPHPMEQAIDSLLSYETPAARYLRENSDAIRRMAAEMDAERESGQ